MPNNTLTTDDTLDAIDAEPERDDIGTYGGRACAAAHDVGFTRGFDLGWGDSLTIVRDALVRAMPALCAAPGCTNVEDAKLVVASRIGTFAGVLHVVDSYLAELEPDPEHVMAEIDWTKFPASNAQALYERGRAELIAE